MESLQQFQMAERCLDRSCDQMEVLVKRIQLLQEKQEAARRSGLEPVAYSLEIQLDVLREVYNMFYRYSEVKANELILLNQKISMKKS